MSGEEDRDRKDIIEELKPITQPPPQTKKHGLRGEKTKKIRKPSAEELQEEIIRRVKEILDIE